MKKFHLVAQKSQAETEEKWAKTKTEISEFIKLHPSKILYFQDMKSYTVKIKNALSKWNTLTFNEKMKE